MNRDDDRWNEAVQEHAATTTWPRLNSAMSALRGPPGLIRRRGPLPPIEQQLRHPDGPERRDAERRRAILEAQARVRASLARLDAWPHGDR